MIKRSISKEKYQVLEEYTALTKKLKSIKEKRDQLVNSFFQDQEKENIISVTVRGEGIAFVVEKQESTAVSWKGLASAVIDEDKIRELLPDFTSTYNKFLVKN